LQRAEDAVTAIASERSTAIICAEGPDVAGGRCRASDPAQGRSSRALTCAVIRMAGHSTRGIPLAGFAGPRSASLCPGAVTQVQEPKRATGRKRIG